MNLIRTVTVTRYITPLREGGSLPAIVEADDGFKYVLKFRGAGQGLKALVAEMIGAELARAAQFKVPEIVFARLDEAFGRTEPDEEIQDLLKASTGLNIGLHYLSGSITYDPAVTAPDSLLASKLVWLDSLLMNVDRTARNTNLLMWNKELWLIDHGAGLYVHHNWPSMQGDAARPFIQIKDHVMLPYATELANANEMMSQLLSQPLLEEIVAAIPNEWLAGYEENEATVKERYLKFLTDRLKASHTFTKHADEARQASI